MDQPLLTVTDLEIAIKTPQGIAIAVAGINLSIQKGHTLALLGESGCGKSMSALSLLKLLPHAAHLAPRSSVQLEHENLNRISPIKLRAIRGRRVGMIFQEPMSSLNPVLTVGQQIDEVLKCHFTFSKKERQQRIIKLLTSVRIPDPERQLKVYPHQLSGGMKQRVMIAIALAGEPELLIADEPTTALDVTIQAQILSLLKDLQKETGMAILLITHDLAVVRQMADDVAVMYAGQIVEYASAQDFYDEPLHPYSQKLFDALPDINKRKQLLNVIPGSVPPLTQAFHGCRFAERCASAWDKCQSTEVPLYDYKKHEVRCHLYAENEKRLQVKQTLNVNEAQTQKSTESKKTILEANNLSVHFPIRKGLFKRIVNTVKAVDKVNLQLYPGKTLALVGESGCGKTTIGRALLRLLNATQGEINFQQENILHLSKRALHDFRREVQIIFQDPYSSMNPRMMVIDIIGEPLLAHKIVKKGPEYTQRVVKLLELVGLNEDALNRYPHEFSGGQRQRICIARALALDPKVIICDEPTSALDVSVQAQILNLLKKLQNELGLSYLFITHDISVVAYLADEVAVMYLGKIVEQGPTEEILLDPKHPYTEALLKAVPKINETIALNSIIKGEQPSPVSPPAGCHFHPRCPHAMTECREVFPGKTQINQQHQVKCYLYGKEQEKNHSGCG